MLFSTGVGLAVASLMAQRGAAVIPMPKSGMPAAPTNGTMPTITYLNPSAFSIDLQGLDDLSPAANKVMESMSSSFMPYLSVQHGAEFGLDSASSNQLTGLKLSLNANSAKSSLLTEVTKTIEEKDESYSLDVPASGQATLTAPTALGLVRGLATFQQLFYSCPVGLQACQGSLFSVSGPVQIQDQPRFPWRGVSLDTSRNFYSLQAIQRTLEGMFLVKLNTLHWHITDSTSWPLQLSAYPELSAAGAYAPDMVYTETDVQQVVAMAASYGIDVVMEIDMPGHTASIGASHPEHVACYESDWRVYAGEPPAGQLRFANASTVNFTLGILDALLPNLPSKYFNQGGDEINKRCYDNDTQTKNDLAATGRTQQQAFSDFVSSVQTKLSSAGKTAIGWHELVDPPATTDGSPAINGNVTLRNDTLIIAWDSLAVKPVVDSGHRIIHGASYNFYLDCGAGAWIPQNGNSSLTRQYWCPMVSWDQAYTFDPYLNVTAAQQDQVVGGEVFIWSETITEATLDPKLWPRAAAAAELWWMGAEPGQYPLDAVAALPRMHEIDYRLRSLGFKSTPIQPKYCALRPGVCV